jgi:hypothetical protein
MTQNTHNRFAAFDERWTAQRIAHREMQEVIANSKKVSNAEQRVACEEHRSKLLVARLNSELDHRKATERHVEAALMDSERLHKAEKDVAAAQQMEVDRREGLFGDYPEMNTALDRNQDYLLRVDNLRKNEVIPDGFVEPSQKSTVKSVRTGNNRCPLPWTNTT